MAKHSFTEHNFGFSSLFTNVEPELLKPEFIAEMENLTLNNKAIDAVKVPLIIGTQIANYPITSIFLWQKDDGTKILFAQCGTKLYRWIDTNWLRIKIFTTDAKVSMVSGMLNKMYILHPVDGLWSYTGTLLTTALTGTVEVVQSSNAVVGTTTAFNTELVVGDRIKIVAETFTVSTITDATHLTLSSNYLGASASGLTAYTDEKAASIATAPKGKYIELWYNRFFIGGNLNDGADNFFRVRWSNLNDSTLWSANDFIDFRTPENSQITGLRAHKQGLFVTTKSSMHQLDLNFSNYQMYSGSLTPLDNQIVILNGFYYISDDGFYRLIVGDIPSTLLNFTKLSEPYKKYWSNISPRSIATLGSKIYALNHDNILAYDVVNESYERYVIPNVNVLYGADYLYLGSTDGKVYKFNQGTTYLPWTLKTRVHNFGLIDSLKRPLKITIYYKASQATSSFIISAYKDSEETSETLGTINYTPPGYLWNNTTWNGGFWNAGISGIVKKVLELRLNLLRIMQFEFSGSKEFGLLGYNVVIRPRYVNIG